MRIECRLETTLEEVEMSGMFKEPYPSLGLGKKPPSLKDLEKSPYYWWWAYLKRNQQYLDCCENAGEGKLANLYNDFGDVRSDDFKAWWGGKLQRGVFLFAERKSDVPKLKELKTKVEWLEEWDSERVKVVVFSTSHTKTQLLAKFEKLLDRYLEAKVGRQSKVTDSTARYPLSNYYDVNHLKKALAVYDAVMASRSLPTDQQLTMWQIGEKLKNISPSAHPPRNLLSADHYAILSSDDSKTRAKKKGIYQTALAAGRIESKQVANARHNVMASTVSRFFNDAQAIVENTALGRFPDKKRNVSSS
jgi:hypothetical protein